MGCGGIRIHYLPSHLHAEGALQFCSSTAEWPGESFEPVMVPQVNSPARHICSPRPPGSNQDASSVAGQKIKVCVWIRLNFEEDQSYDTILIVQRNIPAWYVCGESHRTNFISPLSSRS